jgi:D-alanyl-lipoteichoic acid acyltransferase DltB (MBOAT superfamily)
VTNNFDIDVNGVLFWAVAVAAILLLNVCTSVRAKTVAFAAVNLAFLWLLLGSFLVPVLGAIGLLFIVLRVASLPRLGRFAIVFAGSALLSLFIINKLQGQVHAFARIGPLLSLVGFSFMVLRCVDVLRAVRAGRVASPSGLSLLNYLAPFHMLAAGPIKAFEDHARQPFEHVPVRTGIVLEGVELIARGLFNKFVICYIIDKVFLSDFKSSGSMFVVEMLMFTLWSYLDFSAYSMIALGIGLLAGVPTPINFRNPLIGRNLIDFWDRWHRSLSMFVKNNVFMPIYITLMRRPGPAKPLAYASVATMISFILVGLWHGLSLGWFLWGSLHAVGLVIVRFYGHFLQKRLTAEALAAYRNSNSVRVLATVLTYCYVTFAFYPVAVLSNVRQ